MIMSTVLSTEAYCREQSEGAMPSLVLLPCGEERSTTNRHLFEPCFGTRPNGADVSESSHWL